MAPSVSARASSRSVSLPTIAELHNPNFLDILLPSEPVVVVQDAVPEAAAPSNTMMEALKGAARRTFTQNAAQAYSETDCPTLNAFTTLSHFTSWEDLEAYLEKSWKEDAGLTLRIIWNLRSIHDGKGEKEAFYRAFGWLYDNHPRTAISNLHMLVSPSCESRKKVSSHGYWKDLLNILALATVDELSNISTPAKFLHSERPSTYERHGRNRRQRRRHVPVDNAVSKEKAKEERHVKYEQNHQRLVAKLLQPKYQALYIAVTRLFSEQLLKDIKVWHSVRDLPPEQDKIAILKQLSLAGKWAPTPGGSHDRVTNISTAISELIYATQIMPSYPAVLNTPLIAEERARVLRSFFQRWVLTELRKASHCIEPLMSANRWKEIQYNRVPSTCMKNNTERFFLHDPEGFEKYLVKVEEGKKKISGATLMPHELVYQVMELNRQSYSQSKMPALQAAKKKVAETQARVAEAQWKTLIANLRDAGTIDNAIAVCDVSGSMGSVHYKCDPKHPQPIFPAVALSLVLASLAKPPFNGGFITFSKHPQFVTLDLDTSLAKQVERMVGSHWEMNTDFKAVFLDLLLPLAIQNKVKQEDMIKRIFVFSDMQFDDAGPSSGVWGGQDGAKVWQTNHDVIEKAYKEAGYEMPQIVYWDLIAGGAPTKETDDSRREGVAMLNGFSPAMLKVFMGEQEEAEEVTEWEKLEEDGESVTVVEKKKEEFNPVSVMMKALMKKSYDGLVVVD